MRYTIIDDSVPELQESFLILLRSPLDEADFQPSDGIEVFIIDEDGTYMTYDGVIVYMGGGGGRERERESSP